MKHPILILALLCASAQADILPNKVGLHIGSRHSESGYNNSNRGVFVRWADESDQGWGGGVLRNSHKRTSLWAGYTFTTPSITPLKIRGELTTGVITNYPACNVCPLLQIGGSAQVEHKSNSRLHLGYSPKPRKDGASVWHLMYSREF